MSLLIRQKLKDLLSKWPANAVVTSEWLSHEGFYPQLIRRYVNSGWLVKIGNGAFARKGDNVTWEGFVCALQQKYKNSFHIGAASALEYSGYAHFLPALGKSSFLFLFSNNLEKREKLPAWFVDNADVGCELIRKKIFKDSCIGLKTKVFSSLPLLMSIPERAVLEMLAIIPNKETYGMANLVMQGMQGLRAEWVQKLLVNCVSIKAKRLFLYFSEKYNLPF